MAPVYSGLLASPPRWSHPQTLAVLVKAESLFLHQCVFFPPVLEKPPVQLCTVTLPTFLDSIPDNRTISRLGRECGFPTQVLIQDLVSTKKCGRNSQENSSRCISLPITCHVFVQFCHSYGMRKSILFSTHTPQGRPFDCAASNLPKPLKSEARLGLIPDHWLDVSLALDNSVIAQRFEDNSVTCRSKKESIPQRKTGAKKNKSNRVKYIVSALKSYHPNSFQLVREWPCQSDWGRTRRSSSQGLF